MIVGFNDVLCPKCYQRIRWKGEIRDRPPCPRCGHETPKADLVAAEAEMRRHRDLLETEDDDDEDTEDIL